MYEELRTNFNFIWQWIKFTRRAEKDIGSLQKENKKEDKDEVVIVLLNMLEVVTRDIMDDSVPRSDDMLIVCYLIIKLRKLFYLTNYLSQYARL